MIYLAVVFIIFLLICSIYAFRHGGADARVVVYMMLVAALLTRLVTGLSHDQWPLAMVDGLLMMGLLYVALKSRAYWPLWSAAFHATTVAAHIAVACSPHVDFKRMAAVTSIWSLFSLFVMPLGIMIDQRADIIGK
ncbi:hypothetical protein [Novosphingobium humi]|uniref:hypothetical protein n=1 Tax=Novosphingobium humi TaxID=2282397 RepID=UPI0025AF5301|nr:hypothetical protein [Novosphingobium humi]WJS99913.1 hypothetical protein NYQ05_07175 [Novosphingobium humi]